MFKNSNNSVVECGVNSTQPTAEISSALPSIADTDTVALAAKSKTVSFNGTVSFDTDVPLLTVLNGQHSSDSLEISTDVLKVENSTVKAEGVLAPEIGRAHV